MDAGTDEGYVYLTSLRVHPPIADDTPEGRSQAATQPSAAVVQWVTGTLHHDGAAPKKLSRFDTKPKAKPADPEPIAVKFPVPFRAGRPMDDFVLNGDGRMRGRGGYALPKIVPGYAKPASDGSYPSVTVYFDEVNRKWPFARDTEIKLP